MWCQFVNSTRSIICLAFYWGMSKVTEVHCETTQPLCVCISQHTHHTHTQNIHICHAAGRQPANGSSSTPTRAKHRASWVCTFASNLQTSNYPKSAIRRQTKTTLWLLQSCIRRNTQRRPPPPGQIQIRGRLLCSHMDDTDVAAPADPHKSIVETSGSARVNS